MRKQSPLFLVICLLLCAFTLGSCEGKNEPTDAPLPEESEYRGELAFDGRSYTYRGDAEDISVKDDVVRIVRSGKYLVKGKLTEGRIEVDADGRTTLTLAGAELTSSYGPVIYGRSSSELTLEAFENTVNILSSRGNEKYDNGLPSACVKSRGVLTFSGAGRMVISTQRAAAVMSLLEINVKDTNLSLSGSLYGLWARDLISFDGGRLTVNKAETGLFSSDEVEIRSGVFTALCDSTAIAAQKRISVLGGVASIDAKKPYECGYYDKDKWNKN